MQVRLRFCMWHVPSVPKFTGLCSGVVSTKNSNIHKGSGISSVTGRWFLHCLCRRPCGWSCCCVGVVDARESGTTDQGTRVTKKSARAGPPRTWNSRAPVTREATKRKTTVAFQRLEVARWGLLCRQTPCCGWVCLVCFESGSRAAAGN